MDNSVNYDQENSMSKKDRIKESIKKNKLKQKEKEDKEKENIQISRTRVSIKYTPDK